jgi:glyoxylase-like metal-dependent hydrolase (beta-lactamase superfamily II)
MAIITEAADKIYEIKPEGNGLDRFPLCTAYLVVDEKSALIEAGCPVQASEILNAVEKLGYDAKELSYIIPTHVHGDHAGGAGVWHNGCPKHMWWLSHKRLIYSQIRL